MKSIHPFPFIVEVRCDGRFARLSRLREGRATLGPLCAMCTAGRSRRCRPRYLYMKGPSSARPPRPPPPSSSGADSLRACRDICSACYKQSTEVLPFSALCPSDAESHLHEAHACLNTGRLAKGITYDTIAFLGDSFLMRKTDICKRGWGS